MKKFISRFCVLASLFSLLFFVVFETFAATGTPQIISYQGRLTDSNGDLLGGTSGTTYYFRFSIHDASTGGSKVWPSGAPCTHTRTVRDGVFTAGVGDTSECSDVLDFNFHDNNNVYLQIQVSSDDTTYETLTPRQRITSSGYALNASTTQGALPGTGANNLLKLDASGNIDIAGNIISTGELGITGSTTFRGVEYLWPSADGSAGYVLSTDAAGQLSWVVQASGSGGSGLWATTTDSLTVYPVDTADVVVVGGNATTSDWSSGDFFEVIGGSIFDNATSSGSWNIGGSLGINSEYFSDLTGTGLKNDSNTLTVDDTVFMSLASWFATTTHALISSLPSLSITESQISDLDHWATTSADNFFSTQTFGELSDVSTTSITTNDIVYWNGTSWTTTATSSWDTDTTYTGGTGITESSGTLSFDCSEVEGTGINCTGENITLDSTGAWAGTLTSFGSDFYTFFSATTTDALSQGSTNLYWSNTLFDNRLSASSSIDGITTLSNLSITESQISDLTHWATTSATHHFDTRLSATTTLPNLTTLLGLTDLISTNATTTNATTTSLYISDYLNVNTTATSTFAAGLESSYLNLTGSSATNTASAGFDITSGCYAVNGTCLSNTSGTVTSVDMSVPTGLAIAGNPITTSGTLALTYDTGYGAVKTASTTNWNNFYDTPSTQITAGDHIDWTTNTLNVVTTGDWTGTLDGQEGSYYLNASNLTNFGTPFYTFFNATTTDALTEGSSLYFTNARVNTLINASSTISLPLCSNGQIIEWNGSKWACGADDSGTGGDFAWTVTADGVSTSTQLEFLSGFISKASSTVTGGLTMANSTTSGTARFTGSVQEAAQSIDRIDIGVENGSPRMVFENSGNTIWEIDNDNGIFRWFTPGVERLTLDGSGNLDLKTGGLEVGATSVLTSGRALQNLTGINSSGTIVLGTITSGTWNGTAIGDAYLTKSGDWTGTLDGQEGSYYLNASNLTNFGTPFYTFFNATTTDALSQGSTNLYWSNTLFDNRLSASSSIDGITTLSNLTTLGTITSGTWQGNVIDHERGGLEADVSSYAGLIAITGGSTAQADSIADLSSYFAGETVASTTNVWADAYISSASTWNAKVDTTDIDTVAELNAILSTESLASTTWTGASSLVTVGALDSGSITSNFGNINNGASAITTTGLGTFGNILSNGSTTLQNFTGLNATTTNATTTDLAVSGNLQAGTVISGSWNGSQISEIYGGTNQTSYTTGDILYASGANTLAKLPIGGAGTVLKVSGGVPSWGTDILGSGGSSAFWATTTDDLILHPLYPSQHTLVLGASATTSDWVSTDVIEIIGGILTDDLRATSATTTNATTTNLAISGTATTSDLILSNNFTFGSNTGFLYGTSGAVTASSTIATGYFETTGDWTGTLDGQEGSYYLNASNLTNFGTPFYTFFSATTTDALSQGSTNLYWSNTLFDNRLSASSSIDGITTLSNLSITESQISDLTHWATTSAAHHFDTRLSATTTLPNLTTLLGLTDIISTRATTTSATTTNLYVSNDGIFNGNVGVGTTYPVSLLHVNSSTDGATGVLVQYESNTNDVGNYAGYLFKVSGDTSSGYKKSGIFVERKSGYNDNIMHFAMDVTADNSNANLSDSKMSILSSGNVGIGTTSPYLPLSVVGAGGVVAESYTATSTTATSTFAAGLESSYLNLTGSSATNTASAGFDITSGCYAVNGTCLSSGASTMNGLTDVDTSGVGSSNILMYDGSNWVDQATTTFVMQDEIDTFSELDTIVADASLVNTTNFGTPFYTFFSATTTDALSQGSTNLYWSNTLFDNRLSASSSIDGITTLSNLTTLGTITSGTWQGSVIDHERGGLEADVSSYAGLIAITGGSTVQADSIADLSSYFAGETVASTTNVWADAYISSASTWNAKVDTTDIDTIAELNTILSTESLASTTWTGASSLVTVGALDSGSITSNFGNINNGASAITTTGLGTFGNILSNGSTTLQNFTGLNATTTNATTTNLYASNDGIFSGNVGVGIVAPIEKLQVSGDADDVELLVSTINGKDASLTIMESNSGTDNSNFGITGNGFRFFHDGVDNKLFIQSGTGSTVNTRVTIDRINGNVGIGTTSPYLPLSVVGAGGVVAESYTATSTTATSTFAAGLESSYLNLTGSSATNTASAGFDITSGCYAVNGTCLSSGASTFLGLTDTPSSYTSGSLLFTSGSAVTEDNANLFWDDTNNYLGVATDTPYATLALWSNGTDKVFEVSDTSSTTAMEILADGEVRITDASYAVNYTDGVGDLYVADELEVDGTVVFAGLSYFQSQIQILDNQQIRLGSGGESRIEWDTNQANDALHIDVDVGGADKSGNIMISEDSNTNFNHPIAANPTLYIQSSDETQVDDYLKFWHDQTNANIKYGNGNLSIGNGTATTTIDSSGNMGVGTSTPGSLLSINNIANFTTATSTFYGNGIDLEDGCFAVNGTCLSSGASTMNGLTDVDTSGVGSSNILMYDGSNWVDQATTTFVMQDEIDTFSELDSLVADKSLVNLDDAQTFASLQTFTSGFISNASSTLVGNFTITGNATTTNATTTNLYASNDGIFMGNVGIGIANPEGLLNIFEGSAGSVSPSAKGDNFIIESSGDVGMSLLAPQASDASIIFGNHADATAAEIIWEYDKSQLFISTAKTGGEILLGTANEVEAMRIDSSGNVGIGTTSPYAKLSVDYGAGEIPFAVGSTTATSFMINESGQVGIGSTTPGTTSLLTIDGNAASTSSQVVGLDEYFTFNLSGGGTQFGNEMYVLNNPQTNPNTMVAQMIRVNDGTALANTVRGLEIQAHKGNNTLGENTAISVYGRTFGMKAVTEGDAGGSFLPAGIFAQTRGTTQGNALRAYSGTITSADLLYLYQESSTFTGDALRLNMAVGSGGFTGNFADFELNGTSKFKVEYHGTTTIGDGSNQAGLQIGLGGICVDSDGSCTASTTGRITGVEVQTANSDLAENYSSEEDLETGDIVYTKGMYEIGKADKENEKAVIGIVSTKPGLLLGYKETSNLEGDIYPVALSGRVPVKVSDENGEIKVGDKIILSSLEGVGMSAEGEGGVIVGIALESFDGTTYYSKGVINHSKSNNDFSKNKQTKNEDPFEGKDSCYYGAGGATGEEECVEIPLEPTNSLESSASNGINNEEMQSEINQMENMSADDRATTEGESVKIGKILVFVNLGWHNLDSQIIGGEFDSKNGLIDQNTGQIEETINTFDLTNKDIINVRNILSANGSWQITEDGVLFVERVETKSMRVGTPENPKGIEMYDYDTGKLVCVFVQSGETRSVPGPCSFSGAGSVTEVVPPEEVQPPDIETVGIEILTTTPITEVEPLSAEEGALEDEMISTTTEILINEVELPEEDQLQAMTTPEALVGEEVVEEDLVSTTTPEILIEEIIEEEVVLEDMATSISTATTTLQE